MIVSVQQCGHSIAPVEPVQRQKTFSQNMLRILYFQELEMKLVENVVV